MEFREAQKERKKERKREREKEGILTRRHSNDDITFWDLHINAYISVCVSDPLVIYFICCFLAVDAVV